MFSLTQTSNFQKLKTWDFASKFIVKKTNIDFFHLNRPSYDSQMAILGSWTKRSLIELGPTFIKLGQIVSTRNDIFCKSFIDELVTLQDECPPIEGQNVIDLIENELGHSMDNVFRSFDSKPYKAASIGQVHHGTLLNGRRVIVKVQRPNISEIINDDLKTIRAIFDTFTFMKLMKDTDATLLDESKKYLMKEVDYISEASNARKMRSIFKNNESVIIPRICKKLSTGKLLVMERVDGVKLTDIQSKRSKKKAIQLLFDCFLPQFLEHGIIHGDPHPGNLAFKNDKLILYDFGLVIDVSNIIVETFEDIIICILQKDSKKLVDILVDADMIIPSTSKSKVAFFFEALFSVIALPNIENELKIDVDLEETLEVIKDLGYTDSNRPFTLSNDMIYIGKCISILDGICKQLDGEYNAVDYVKPRVETKLKSVDLRFDGAFIDFLEVPSHVRNINSAMLSIEKSTYSMRARTSSMSNEIRHTQFLLLSFILYTICNLQ